jgi:hypothetical protein
MPAFKKLYGGEDDRTASALFSRGLCLIKMKRFIEGGESLSQGYKRHVKIFGVDHPNCESLVRILMKLGIELEDKDTKVKIMKTLYDVSMKERGQDDDETKAFDTILKSIKH